MLNFSTSKEDGELIRQIVDRALVMMRKTTGAEPSVSKMELSMDLTATHANGNPLKLAELLVANDFNFSHDVFGIYRHINRKDGTLGDCFLPRFSVPQAVAA